MSPEAPPDPDDATNPPDRPVDSHPPAAQEAADGSEEAEVNEKKVRRRRGDIELKR